MDVKYYLFVITVIITACSSSNQKKDNADKFQIVPTHYATRFAIKKTMNYTVLELLGNKNNSEVTATFVLYKNQKPAYSENAYYIKTPVKTVACMSSIYSAMLSKLKCEQAIVAIDNIDYYTNSFIKNKVQEKKIIELSKGAQVDIEKTIALKPDLFLTFGMGNPKEDADQKLVSAGIPIAISIDHLEETPLARAEWIKFFSYFFNKENLADSLFTETEKKYAYLKSLTENLKTKPTVLTEIKYGDAWYVPSGKSYMAHLINDAGGNYFWKDDHKTGSTPLSFETVYAKAKDCDIWINLYNINTKKEMLSYDERYSFFKAYKNNGLYNNNKNQNTNGYSNYWETGITNPEEVLADLIHIFNPSLLPNHTFTFYKKIE
jgi:iron complex transport system substrate-binding protein